MYYSIDIQKHFYNILLQYNKYIEIFFKRIRTKQWRLQKCIHSIDYVFHAAGWSSNLQGDESMQESGICIYIYPQFYNSKHYVYSNIFKTVLAGFEVPQYDLIYTIFLPLGIRKCLNQQQRKMKNYTLHLQYNYCSLEPEGGEYFPSNSR